jgi:nucleolar protein 53
MKFFSEFQDQVIETQDQKRIFGDLLCNLKDSSLYYTDTTPKFTLPKVKMDEILKPDSKVPSVPHPRRKKSFKILENGKKISKNFSLKVAKLVKASKHISSIRELKIDRNLAVWDVVTEKKRKLQASRGGEYLKEEEAVKKPILPRIDKVEMEISPPGASYNPDKKDHEELIQEAYQEELEKIEKKEKLLEKLEYPKELDDLSNDMTKEIQQESSSEDVDVEASKLVSRKRKTRAERNKARKLEEKRKDLKRENQQKKIEKDINKIQEIENQLLILAKPKMKNKKDVSRVTLGPLKFRKDGMTVQLSDEISDNLRTFKPEGNLFKDVFKAFQKNQMIETRLPLSAKASKRKYKLKETESHDYKRFK